ncbi:hypothetical protein B0H10DRAFT_2236122 [Mycena sp. CBHHK59/15]|nr:hypothetical protein B0H10DRAFT_2236122 [Mycena sp. CBHHK59/15]
MSSSMRSEGPRMDAAAALVSKELLDKTFVNRRRSWYIFRDLFEDRIRIGFAAASYNDLMLNYVVGHPSWHYGDQHRVAQLGGECVQEHLIATGKVPSSASTPLASPIQVVPAFLESTVSSVQSSPVTDADTTKWRKNPEELVGSTFFLGEVETRLVVSNYGNMSYSSEYSDDYSVDGLLGILASAEQAERPKEATVYKP